MTQEGLLKIEGWARDGCTDKEIAANIGINPDTLYTWKKKFPILADTLKKGKDVVDRQVEKSLLQRALGYSYDETSEKYEVMYIINPAVGEEGIAAIVEKFKTLIETNGTIDEMEEMGKRKLAYEINYISEGYYVLVKFTSAPEFPAELDRILGITEGVIRSMITLRYE